MLDPHTRFSITVDDYTRGRPSYPQALVDKVLSMTPGRRVADIGCGTGIASRQFAAAGCDVVGIDPNPDMLAAARAGGGARYTQGDATATGLRSSSMDLVIVAQAFHWFPIDEALAEMARILAPGGVVAVFWNVRRTTARLRAYDGLLKAHVRDYAGRPKPAPSVAALRSRLPHGREHQFRWRDNLDRKTFVARARSASIVAHSAEPAFYDALAPYFDDHAVEGRVPVDYETQLFAWQPDAGPYLASAC